LDEGEQKRLQERAAAATLAMKKLDEAMFAAEHTISLLSNYRLTDLDFVFIWERKLDVGACE
jgi:hypothetical protein